MMQRGNAQLPPPKVQRSVPKVTVPALGPTAQGAQRQRMQGQDERKELRSEAERARSGEGSSKRQLSKSAEPGSRLGANAQFDPVMVSHWPPLVNSCVGVTSARIGTAQCQMSSSATEHTEQQRNRTRWQMHAQPNAQMRHDAARTEQLRGEQQSSRESGARKAQPGGPNEPMKGVLKTGYSLVILGAS